jgi:hypothetical protein
MPDRLRRVRLLLHFVTWFGLVGLVLPYTAIAGEGSDFIKDKPSAIAVFGGLVTNNNWEDALAPWDLGYRESCCLVAWLDLWHGWGAMDF